jgi:hypothetical protein
MRCNSGDLHLLDGFRREGDGVLNQLIAPRNGRQGSANRNSSDNAPNGVTSSHHANTSLGKFIHRMLQSTFSVTGGVGGGWKLSEYPP